MLKCYNAIVSTDAPLIMSFIVQELKILSCGIYSFILCLLDQYHLTQDLYIICFKIFISQMPQKCYSKIHNVFC